MARPDLVAGAATLGYSALVNRVVPRRWHPPANLAAAGALVLYARHAGASSSELGLHRGSVRDGLRIGLSVALPAAAVVAALSSSPPTRMLFADERHADGASPTALYETLVRIPFGTALSEELIFRGALLGLATMRRSPIAAAAWSSLLFGLWHILPTLDGVELHALGDHVRDRPGGVAGTVTASAVATAAAGLGFTWLRVRAGGVLAPAVVHAAVNATAYIGGRRALRRSVPPIAAR